MYVYVHIPSGKLVECGVTLDYILDHKKWHHPGIIREEWELVGEKING